ncbi:MAG: glycosyl hydrolase [Stellaceae bacterium]
MSDHSARRTGAPAPRTSLVVILILAVGALSTAAQASEKKGVGVWEPHAREHLAQLHVAWYYTWTPHPVEGAPPAEFVPMIWGGSNVSVQIKALPRRVSILLTINEPDEKKQANMSVERVARLWPRLSARADRVSSPAAEHAMGTWIEQFLRIAHRRHLKTSFMAVHLYGGTDAGRFLARLDAIHERYRMPIWLTEFGVADWDAAPWRRKSTVNRYSEEAVLQFMKEVLPGLERRPYVIRYAWFGAGAGVGEELRTSRLFESDGTLTPLGRFYSNFDAAH